MVNFAVTPDIIAILSIDGVLSLLRGFKVIEHKGFLQAKILIAVILIFITFFGE